MVKHKSYRAGSNVRVPVKKTVGRKRKRDGKTRRFKGKVFTQVPGSPFYYRSTANKIAKKEKKAGAKGIRIIRGGKKGETSYKVFSHY